MLLAIDSGNTRTKWAVFNDQGEILHHGVCLNTEIEAIDFLPLTLVYERAIISSVAGEQLAAALAKKLTHLGVAIHWLKSTAKCGNVLNRYSTPENFGTDRWASLIAAWHIKQASCVVVNAGTAVTIDALSVNNGQAEFIGGMILPGIDLMLKSLGTATAQLPNIASEQPTTAGINQQHDIFAKNTIEAMRIGALNAACGAILQMLAALSAKCEHAPYIVLSGGDAQRIHDNLSGDVTSRVLIVDNLVLHGLFLIDKFTSTTVRQNGQQ